MKKKPWRYYHFTHVYHKWQSYDVWFLRYWAQQTANFLSFLGHFCTFTPPTTQKIKILKKWKTHIEISSFYKLVPKIMIICYTIPEIWCITDVISIFHFGLFLLFYTPNSLKNQNFKKMKKNNIWRYHHFTYVYQKLWSNYVRFLRYGAWRTDGQMDRCTYGRTEKMT